MKNGHESLRPWDEQDLERPAGEITVDLYGVKVSARPQNVPDDLPNPGSWVEVANRVHNDLKGITAGLVRFVRVGILSATNFLAGIGDLSGSVNERIKRAHDHADRVELEKQSDSRLTEELQPDSEQALGQLVALLQEKRVKGLLAGVTVDEESGLLSIHVLPPGSEGAVDEILQRTARALGPGGGLVAHSSGQKPFTVSASREFEHFFTLVEEEDAHLGEVVRQAQCLVRDTQVILQVESKDLSLFRHPAHELDIASLKEQLSPEVLEEVEAAKKQGVVRRALLQEKARQVFGLDTEVVIGELE